MESKKTDLWNISLIAVIVFGLLFIYIISNHETYEYIDESALNWGEFIFFSIVIPTFTIIISKILGKQTKYRIFIALWVSTVLACLLGGLFLTLNRTLDDEYPVQELVIVDKKNWVQAKSGEHREFSVYYDGEIIELLVYEQTYHSYSVGDKFPTIPSEGFFGIAYLEYER